MDKGSSIFLAGHKGLVGSAVYKKLKSKGFKKIITLDKKKVDLRNYDKPGFIGDLGNKLGNNNINIASFHLGRRNVGGEAIALVEIDGKIDEKIISEIRNLPQVARVNSINFEGR